jgi:DNA-binding MarR family transcriptional regulator
MDGFRGTLLGLFTEIAIIEHLLRTRVEQRSADGLESAQFGILNYFIGTHEGPDTVAGIAWAFQDPVPLVQERVDRLAEMGFLSITPAIGNGDAVVSLTADGRKAHQEALDRIEPEILELVSEISRDDIERTFRTLREIRLTLDNLPDR